MVLIMNKVLCGRWENLVFHNIDISVSCHCQDFKATVLQFVELSLHASELSFMLFHPP